MSREIINELREQLKIMNDKLDKLESSLEDKEKTKSLTFVLKKELINKPVYVSELYKIDSSSINKKEPVLIKRCNILEDTEPSGRIMTPLNKELIARYKEEARRSNKVSFCGGLHTVELLERENPIPYSFTSNTIDNLLRVAGINKKYGFFNKLYIINLYTLAYNHDKHKSTEEHLIDILPDDIDYYIEYTTTRKLTQAERDALNESGNVVKISKKDTNERGV